VNVRLTGIGVMPKIVPPQVRDHGALDDALVKTAPCVFRVNGALRGSPRHLSNASGWPLVLLSQGRPWSCNRTPRRWRRRVLSCTLTPGET